MKKVTIFGMLFVILCLFVSSSFALDPLGPPAAGLRQGGWSLGLDYTFNQMNLRVKQTNGSKYDAKSAQIDKTYVNLGYGVADNWEVFGRLGSSKFVEEEEIEIDGTNRTAWGLGTKVTIAQDGNLKWGAMYQISWNKSKDVWDGGYDQIKWCEYQIAAGPTYKLTDKVSIYGGPFYNYFNDKLSSDNGKWGNTNAPKRIGGYIGGQFAVNDNLSLNAEYQLITDASGLGLQLVWKF